jgi:hypothetical protein
MVIERKTWEESDSAKESKRYNYETVTNEVVDDLSKHADLIKAINDANTAEHQLAAETFSGMANVEL